MKVKEFGYNIVTPTGIPKQNDTKSFQATSTIGMPTLHEVIGSLLQEVEQSYELLEDVPEGPHRHWLERSLGEFKHEIEAIRDK